MSLDCAFHVVHYDLQAHAGSCLNLNIRLSDILRLIFAINISWLTSSPNNYATQFGYDSLDHLKTVTDAKGLTTSYSYDALDNLLQRQSPDTGTISRTYDDAGNRLTETDAKSQLTTYSYDALNRVKQISYAGGANLVYTYDVGANSLGRLSTLTDPNGATRYGYDSHGRVISDTRTINTRTFVTQYRYDAYGRLDRITYPSGRLVNYSFDTQGRINDITTTSTLATFTAVQTTQYAPFGGATGLTLGNGFTAHRAIDLDSRIASYSLGNATMSLGYDPDSRLTSAQESGTTVSRIFDYDPLDRLIHTQVPSAVYDYSYDAVGNRLTEKVGLTTYNYTYPTTSHRLASVSSPKARSFSYDANGSMTGNGSQQFVYNSLGRLHQVITTLGTYQYRINGLGQRVMKIPPTGNRTIFHYDLDGRLLAETDGLGVVVKETIWHGATPVAIVLPPTSTKPERIYYIHADQLNTPRVVVNTRNAVLWRWDPEPFGTALPNEDVDGNGEKLVMNLRYPGQYYDQETGLNYNNFRDYDSSIGRYIQSDPIGLAGGINTYGYVNGNSINFVDPTGQFLVLPWVIGAGIDIVADVVSIGVGAIIGKTAADYIYNANRGDVVTDGPDGPFSVVVPGRIKSNDQLKKDWEDANGIPWPTDPETGDSQDAHHKIPRNDGGTDHQSNIEPKTRRDHIDWHKSRGDFKRWQDRRRKSCP